MASMVITVGSFTKSKTISNGDLSRFLTAYMGIYGQVPVTPPTEPPTFRDMTQQETFDKFANGLYQGMMDAVKNQEKAAAAKTAADAIQPISIA